MGNFSAERESRMPKRKIKKAGKTSPKQPTIFRQKRRNGQDTTFTVIDGRRIHLGVYGTPEAEKAPLIFLATCRRRMEHRHYRSESKHRSHHCRRDRICAQITVRKSSYLFSRFWTSGKNDSGQPPKHCHSDAEESPPSPTPPDSAEQPSDKESKN